MCGGLRTIACRSADGVSPVRTAVRISTGGVPRSNSAVPMPSSGSERFLWMSLESARNGDT